MSADAVRAAYDALTAGDVEPLVALLDPTVEWRGRRSIRRLWEPVPG